MNVLAAEPDLEPWTDPDHPDPALDAAYRSGIVPDLQRGRKNEHGWDAITVLRARGRRLAKLIGRDGTITDYDSAKHFDLSEIPIDGLDHLEEDLRRLLRQPDRCIVRGQIADLGHVTGVRRLLHPESDDLPTLVEVPRRWVAFDIDGLDRPADADLVACAVIGITALPDEFHPARCLVQATASHGFKPGLRLRLWYWLGRPVSTAELKRWLPPTLVDHSVFIGNQPIYTAAPLFDGRSDPLPARLVRLAGAACVTVPDLPEPEKPPPLPPVKPAIGLNRYGEVALDNICRRMAGAIAGGRDRAISGGAYSAGQLVGAGALPHGFTLRCVHYAAAQGVPGYSQRDRSKVDRSFANGVRNPREVRP
jgi:hypothetical protein